MAEKCSVHDGEFAITLPLYDNSGRKIKRADLDGYIKRFNEKFGGSSTILMEGCYNDKNKTQCEPVMKVTSVRDFNSPYAQFHKVSCEDKKKVMQDDCKFVKDLSKEAQKEFGQYSTLSTCQSIDEGILINRKVNVLLRKRRKELPIEMTGKPTLFH